MFARSGPEAWHEFGLRDPYFGVLNAPRFRTAHSPGAARSEFFATGEAHVEALWREIRASIDPDFRPARALDFGCGVGRILIPLASRVTEVVGVDISEPMLEEARRNCSAAGLRNVLLAHAAGLQSRCRPFNFIHSYIVFQHMRPAQALQSVDSLLQLLAPDGVGALHFVYHAERPAAARAVHLLRRSLPLVHPLLNLIQGRSARSPLMQMHVHDLNALVRLLQRRGCHRLSVRFSDHGGWWGVFLIFQRRSQLDTGIT